MGGVGYLGGGADAWEHHGLDLEGMGITMDDVPNRPLTDDEAIALEVYEGIMKAVKREGRWGESEELMGGMEGVLEYARLDLQRLKWRISVVLGESGGR